MEEEKKKRENKYQENLDILDEKNFEYSKNGPTRTARRSGREFANTAQRSSTGPSIKKPG